VFAIKGQSLEEHWDYLDKSFMFPEGANLILDDGGDATLYILLGARMEAGEDVLSCATSEEEEVIKRRSKSAWPKPRLVHEKDARDPRRIRGNNNRRAPSV